MDRLDVAALREAEFPWADERIYLNSASTGPLPARTARLVRSFNDRRVSVYPLPEDMVSVALDGAREAAGRLINAPADEIALATNTSYGINLAAAGLPMDRGDVVLVSDGEFPANVYPWMRQADRGVKLEVVPLSKEGWPDEECIMERMRDPRVRVLAVSLVQFASGYQVDLDRLSAAARDTGTWLVVDAIQGLGCIPLDVARTRVDILACGAQKWLLSPWGAGFAYVRRELWEEIRSPWAGWLAYQGNDDFTTLTSYNPKLRDDARRFELVTLPFQDLAGMVPSIELLLELGIDRIRRHIKELHRPVLEWADASGVKVVSPRGARGSGMLCIAPPKPERAMQKLAEIGVVTSYRENAVRLAPHCFNTVEEMERVRDVLDRAL